MAVSSKEISEARKVGYRKRKPKQPTGKSKNINSVRAYIERLKNWESEIKEAARLAKKLK